MSSVLEGADLYRQYHQFFVPNYDPHPVHLIKGQGSLVYDEKGKRYIDLAGGIAVTALGHQHPALIVAIEQATKHIWHLSNYWTNTPAIDLAQKLCEHSFAERVFLCNSGAEANEAALKLARKYAYDTFGADSKKHNIIAFEGSFHGRTLFTASVAAQAKYSRMFAPLPGGITHVPFNNIDAFRQSIDSNCCAVIVEPVQGEGGVIPAKQTFLQTLRELCDTHQALLIFDEVQSGIGRSGALFAYQHFQVTPDILTSAKALGGGLPIGAMLTSEKIGKHLTLGSHGSTNGGNPFVAQVALAVLENVANPKLLNGVEKRTQIALELLKKTNTKYQCFHEIRHLGLLIGCELTPHWQGRGKAIIATALDRGVLCLPAAGGQVIRFAPPLNIPLQLLEEGLHILSDAIASYH